MITSLIAFVGGVLIPGWLYIANKIRFKQKKREAEALTGVEVKTSWKKHKHALCIGWFKWFALFYLLLLLGQAWLHPDVLMLTTVVLVAPPLSMGIPYFGIKGLKRNFLLKEFIDTEELTLWYEDSREPSRTFWFNELERMRDKSIAHIDYLPLIQDTVPIIHEKHELIQLLKYAKAGNLSEFEQVSVTKVEERLNKIEDDLISRWKELRIALGQETRPEVIQSEKEKSLRQMEELLEKEGEVSRIQVDPALKELYALTENVEAPEDIKLLASNTIRDIEGKLASEANRHKEELIRLSAEATIKTSRRFHGIQE